MMKRPARHARTTSGSTILDHWGRAMRFFGNKWDFLLAGLLIVVAIVVILYV